MSKKPNYMKIGIFVLGAIVLLILLLLFVGIGALQQELVYFETYFDSSVHGLSIGAVIEDRGVPVGKVEKITFVDREYDIDQTNIKYGRYVMVVGSVKWDGSNDMTEEELKRMIKQQVDNGLRVSLVRKPLTGVAYLNAEFIDPQKNPPLTITWDPKYLYVPSMPSLLTRYSKSIGEILEDLSNVNMTDLSRKLEKILNSLDSTLGNTDSLVQDIRTSINDFIAEAESLDLQKYFESFQKLMERLDTTLEDAQVGKLSEDAQQMLNEAREAMRRFKELMGDLDKRDKITTLAQVLDQLDTTLWRVEKMVDNKDPEIGRLLQSTQEAVDQLKELIKRIQQHPSEAFFSEPPPKSEYLK